MKNKIKLIFKISLFIMILTPVISKAECTRDDELVAKFINSQSFLGDCDKTIYHSNGKMARYRHKGYSDDGTWYHSNGKVALYKRKGYSDDGTWYHSNGKVALYKRKGYSDDGTWYHSNGKVALYKRKGYSDDGTWYHSNGKVALYKRKGYSDDGTLYYYNGKKAGQSNNINTKQMVRFLSKNDKGMTPASKKLFRIMALKIKNEQNANSIQFKVKGSKGSATVRLNSDDDREAVKKAIKAALN